MKRFLKQVALFLLPLLLLAAGLFKLDCPQEFRFHYLEKDCDDRADWIYSRLFCQDKPADIVFIGSSRTMRAVDDSLLSDMISTDTHHATALNAGYCRLGRDLQAVLADDLFWKTGKYQPPKKLVIEIHEQEGVGSHPVFYCLAGSRDLLFPPSFVNQDYFSNVYNGWLMRLAWQRKRFTEGAFIPMYPQWSKTFGAFHTDHLADPKELAEVKAKNESKVRENEATGWTAFQLRYNFAWIERMVRLAKSRNCEVEFLYLPEYGCSKVVPRDKKFYEQFGHILIPPAAILDDPNNWSDHDHFNNNGSKALTQWLADQVGTMKPPSIR